MLLPKGLWVVSVLAVPGDLLRLVYVTRDILARVHCFDVCAFLSHVSFATGPQVIQSQRFGVAQFSFASLKIRCELRRTKESLTLRHHQQLRRPTHSMRPLLGLTSQHRRPMGIPLVHTEILIASYAHESYWSELGFLANSLDSKLTRITSTTTTTPDSARRLPGEADLGLPRGLLRLMTS